MKWHVMRYGSALSIIGHNKQAISTLTLRSLNGYFTGSLSSCNAIRKRRRGSFLIASLLAIGTFCTDIPHITQFIAFPIDTVNFGMELAAGRIARLDIQDTPVLREWNVVVRSDLTMSPAVQTLFDFLRDEGAELMRAMMEGGLAV